MKSIIKVLGVLCAVLALALTTLNATAAPNRHRASLKITTSSLPGGVTGSAYSYTVTTSGGSAPVTMSATGLATGLKISSTGVISGTPTTAGTSSVTLQARDNRGTTASATLPLVVTAPASSTPSSGSSTSPTPTPTPTATATPTPTPTPTATATPTPTPTPTATPTPTPTATSTATPTPTSSSTATATPTGVCTNPVYKTTDPNASWGQGPVVNQDVWGASGSNWSQELDACSPTSWNVVANYQADGGAIQSYPDTQYTLGGKTVSQYNSMQTCFGDKHPTGGEWDYGYDVWSDNWNVEIMVWNDWTDTGIYPPANSRAVTINGVAYHEWKGGGANEWIYTRDDHATSGCFDMLGIYKDLIAHEPTSGLTANSVPGAIEYGVEIASTNGPETFSVTNASLTTN